MLISAESNVSLCTKLLLPLANTVCRSCLTPNHSFELGRSELAVGIAQPAVVRDADKVRLGDVDARVEVLARAVTVTHRLMQLQSPIDWSQFATIQSPIDSYSYRCPQRA